MRVPSRGAPRASLRGKEPSATASARGDDVRWYRGSTYAPVVFEVCGAHSKDSNNLWIAQEGVYLPAKGSDTEDDAHGEL